MAKLVITDIAGEDKVIDQAGFVQVKEGFVWVFAPDAGGYDAPLYMVHEDRVLSVEQQG